VDKDQQRIGLIFRSSLQAL